MGAYTGVGAGGAALRREAEGARSALKYNKIIILSIVDDHFDYTHYVDIHCIRILEK